jgi:TorA maturation chaperone TorD
MTDAAAAIWAGAEEMARFQAFKAAVAGDLELLAGLHDREPTAAVVAAVQSCPIDRQLGLTLLSEPGKAAAAAFDLTAGALPNPPTEEALDDLAAGFADVYLRHTYRAAPAESVWQTEDGLERQAPMFEIREWYRRHDLVVADWASRPDDHLVLQLRFIAHTFSHAASPADLADTANFMDQHILCWIKKFAVRLVHGGAPDWYSAVALLTASYLDELRDHLAGLTGIARPVASQPKKVRARPPELEDRPYVPGVAPSW